MIGTIIAIDADSSAYGIFVFIFLSTIYTTFWNFFLQNINLNTKKKLYNKYYNCSYN